MQFRESPKQKSILSIYEVKELFSDENINYIWDRNLTHFTLNLLTATAGMFLVKFRVCKTRIFTRDIFPLKIARILSIG